MGEKTAEMDRYLTRVSATMVEFVSGISVVKAFGTVGRAHERFSHAAEDFARFYVAWCGPLLKGSALGQAAVSPSMILLISTAGGSALAATGIVSPVQVITCALIALVIPAAIEVLGSTVWSYQIAGAAALRIVLQDPQLLDISVRENIALGRPDAKDEAIWAAATAARIDDYVRSLPRGLDSVIGEDAHPSGGQAQRIAIARALLVDAPILVLDEATAFTDPEAEAEIQAALTRLVQGKTVLVIAHRAASIIGVDQIAILEAGRLIARGTPDELADHPYLRELSAPGKGH